ncbi:MAG TPA: FemAB family XrtA/PEP-CTERM system-associated protein [Rhizomicrobium sp.]|jgi:FemAB-related protein (PEP-CTERM system-associated)|nr:FemAB family XrtA/PEP-CTERM system-associated protein [Rhizomicrobium sp.]
MEGISVSGLEPGEEGAWDSFVRNVPEATFFHLSGWRRVIEKAFGHRTFYLVARRNREIRGVLPLTQVRSLIFGNSLISNAFCVHGGIVADLPEARDLLAAAALEIARNLRVDCVEFRSTTVSQPNWLNRDNLYVTFRRAMSAEADANLKAIPRKQRAMVRKGIANGLKSEIDNDVGRLHHIYAESVRRLGSPVFPRRYFQLLKDEFGQACDVVTVSHGKRAIASVMNFYFRDEVLPYYGGGLIRARALAGNDFMYWEVMRRACERGYRIFDFGRSKIGTGSYDFKHNWGFEPMRLSYEYLPINAKEIRDVNPLNPRYRVAIGLWRRLPLSLTKLIGPAIVRSIG